MKKLVLKELNLGSGDILQRNQLKSIFGGYGNGFCYKCCNGSNCSGCTQCDQTCVCSGGATLTSCGAC